MAMEKQYTVRDTHPRAITALGFHPMRREILIGCEDGVIKSWESEGGKLVSTSHEHKGWVTDFLFWSDMKVMLSSANDGEIIIWGSGGSPSDRISVGVPVYSMVINPRKNQLVCGLNAAIKFYDLDKDRESGHIINPFCSYTAREHTDIVQCLVCHESRLYTAGYDQQMIIYDASYTDKREMETIMINSQAHDAGITCLLLVKDNENNTWIVTGSFDKTVKIWSPDGKLVHRLDGFQKAITGVAYVPRNKTIWAAGGMPYAYLYDPKSGDNVSDFIGTFQAQEEEKYCLQLLRYFPEQQQVIASTSRRHLMVWKYNSSGCITALKCKAPLESLCYTKKVPILIFSGDAGGVIEKWERMQSNHFMYSKETFPLADAKKAKKKKKHRDDKKEAERLEEFENQNNRRVKDIQSHYAFNKPMIPPVSEHFHRNTAMLKVMFVECLDLIIAACEDSNIYVWGFDEEAVQVLKSMKPQEDPSYLINRYKILLDKDSELLPENNAYKATDGDSVTNRVAGFICKYIFSEHTSCVTSLAVVGRENGFDGTYLISASWDRRICIWDLEAGQLHDSFRNASSNTSTDNVVLASDGIITDLAYCSTRNEFAYSSSDKMVYLRRFSSDGSEMVLLNTLQGHYGEVTCVKWNPLFGKWVTGSEDGTIRIWAGDGLNECEQVLGVQGSVSALCLDQVNGAIICGVSEYIKVYEPEQYRLIQTNVGHTDSVRSIIHIKERSQYVSASWDKSIRIWNAWKMPHKKPTPKGKQGDIEMMLDEISVEMKVIAEETETEDYTDECDGDGTSEI